MDKGHACDTEEPVTKPLSDQSALPSISVVMCTRDRPDTIARAVSSVAAQQYPEFEILIIDQSRTDDTRAIVRDLMSEHPQVRYLHVDEAGLSRAYNTGVRNTSGAVLAFTDDDCMAPPDWLAHIARALDAEPDTEVLYGQVLLPPELQALENTKGVTPMLPIARRRRMNRREGFQIFGMGANFAARRSMFERVGGFDEILGGGGPLKSSQDFDLAYRVFRAGGTILLEPDVVVYHYGFRPMADWPMTVRAYGVGDGGFYFKHVRAGDAYAAWLLARAILGSTLRYAKHMVQRSPHPTQGLYASSILRGMWASLQYGVDRANRLYYIR
jgi:glycosyltransferase involved in cell wall biosynthesis